MKKVKNPTNLRVTIPNVVSFAAGEVREVTDEEAAHLLNGTCLVEVVDEIEPKKKSSKKKDNE